MSWLPLLSVLPMAALIAFCVHQYLTYEDVPDGK